MKPHEIADRKQKRPEILQSHDGFDWYAWLRDVPFWAGLEGDHRGEVGL